MFDGVDHIDLPEPKFVDIEVPPNGADLREIVIPPEYVKSLALNRGRLSSSILKFRRAHIALTCTMRHRILNACPLTI